MIGKIILLSTLALVQGRPQVSRSGTPNDLCPPDQSHWLVPHEWDCTRFYYCEYGILRDDVRDCAPGTHFSYEHQVCIHEVIANCNLPNVPPTEGPEEPETDPVTEAPSSTEAAIVSTTTTTQAPASTEAGIVSTTTTTTQAPASTEAGIVSTTTTTTQAPSSTEAAIVSTTTTTQAPASTEASIVSTTTTQAPASTEASIISTTSKPVEDELLPNGCPADFDVHQLLPHESQCNLFYYCVHGEKVLSECAKGTYFSPELQECDWPENVECTNGEEDDDVIVEGSGDPDLDTEIEGELLDNGCPADFHVHKLLPHETDCDKFYYCNFGEKVVRTCAPGTYFNYEIQVCDHAENVDCANSNGNGETEGDGGDNGEDEGNDGGDDGNDNEDSANGGEDDGNETEIEYWPNGCPVDYSIEQLLPHADCDKFYHCVHGNKVVRTCAPGTHFSFEKQECDWPENVGCLSSGNGSEDNSNGGEDNGNGGEDNGNGGEDNGNGDEDSGNGGDDNENDGDDDGDDNQVEYLPNGCPVNYHFEQLLPHAECGKYYQCVHGNKVERTCAAGTHFNFEKQICDWPESAGCVSSGNVGEDNGNGGEDNGNGGEDNGNGGDDNENDGGDDGDDNQVEYLPNGCPNNYLFEQLLPHAECDKYYQCVHGNKVERSCAAGTHFNFDKQVCDWPQYAGCTSSGNGEDNGNGGEDTGNGSEDNENGGEDSENEEGDNENDGEGNENGGEGNENGGEDNGNEGEDEVEFLPNGCPADFSELLLPHEDCTKYYQCVHGQTIERPCASGTFFNQETQACDLTECAGNEGSEDSDDNNENGGEDNGDGVEDNENGGEDNENGGEDNENGGEDNENGGEDNGDGEEDNGDDGGDNGNDGEDGEDVDEFLPNGCPSDYSVELLLPHDNCDQYYQCVHGETVERNCAANTFFNPATQECDWTVCGGVDDGDNGDEGDDNENGGNGEEDNGNDGEDNGDGGDDNENGGEDNENGGEDNENGGEDNENGGEDNEDGGEDNEDGGEDNENGGEDNEDGEGVDEFLPNGCPSDYSIELLLPHDNCNQFYQCVHGETVERTCAAGTFFNPATQVCDWTVCGGEEDSGDGEDGGNGEDGDNGEDGGDGEDGANGEDGDNGGDGEDGGNGDDNRCAESCNVPAWAHEDDCDKFWRCDGNQKVLGVCSEGLHFNVNTQTCDFICNAGCVRTNIQATASADGLKVFMPWDKVDDELTHALHL